MSTERDRAGRWRQVAWSMQVAALYDVGFALAILLDHRRAADWLRLVAPADPIYLRLNGVLLLVLAGMYALPAFSPSRYQGVVGVALAGRTLGFVYLTGVFLSGGPPTFLLLGLGDLAFALLHAALLVRARRPAIAANP